MTLSLQMQGRTGNQLFQYAYARAFCEAQGDELRTPRWVGEKIFEIPTTAEPDYSDWGRVISGYCQNQESLIYTRKQVREWFRFKPDIEDALIDRVPLFENVAHLRRGDYYGYGYVVVSKDSYERLAKQLDLNGLYYVSEEPQVDNGFHDEIKWLPDFYTMMQARTLLRANSCFSWWAGTLGNDNRIYSPVITGLLGGREQDCEWVLGNHPKFADLPNITDLHLKES